MNKIFGKIVIGASAVIGLGTVAVNPAQAVSFSYNNSNQIRTYSGGSDGVFINNSTTDATNVLTDNDVTSNVELWYTDENPTTDVGFTATEGIYSATVSSVTASDWSIFRDQWLSDLFNVYTPFQSVWNGFSANTQTLVKNYLPSLGMGDPNIGNFAFGQNGGVELKLVGHLNVKDLLYTAVSSQINTAWDSGVKSLFPTGTTLSSLTTTAIDTKILQLQAQVNSLNGNAKATAQAQLDRLMLFKDAFTLQQAVNAYQGQIGASEIAKVVTGGQTYYAYGFNSFASGITASDDGRSYNGLYTWSTPGYISKDSNSLDPSNTPGAKAVPEPSAIVGLLGVLGIFAAKRNKLNKASG